MFGMAEAIASNVDIGMEDGNASNVEIDTGLEVAIASAVEANPFAWLIGFMIKPQAKENKINMEKSKTLKLRDITISFVVYNHKTIFIFLQRDICTGNIFDFLFSFYGFDVGKPIGLVTLIATSRSFWSPGPETIKAICSPD